MTRGAARSIVVATLAAAALVACSRNPVERSGEPQLTLSPDSVVVSVFTSSALSATVRDAGGAMPSAGLHYVSRDHGVATVDAGGTISAVAVGATHVVATLPDRPEVRDSVRVRVYADSCSGARPDFGGAAGEEERKLFGYDVDAPLNLRQTIESSGDGVEVSTISFGSPDGGAVTGMLWVPATRSSLRPGVVLMHGIPGKARDVSPDAQSLARQGAVVIAIDAPFARRPGGLGGLTFSPLDRAEQIQLIRDLQRSVDVLRARPDVDVDRIAFVGFSYGGALGALFVGIERRLKAAALVVGHAGQVSHFTGPAGSRLIASLPCARRVAWIRAMAPIEPIRFVGNANMPLLLQNGRFDEYVPVYEAEELHAAAPQPRTIRWYDAGHGLGQQARADRLQWLRERIGLDAPAAGGT